MRLLLRPEHAGQAERHFNATRVALQHYSEWFGPYPYDHLTIVDPAFQSDADGMEYPTLITVGTSWLLPAELTFSAPDETAIHEAGHQWFYGIVGNNEFEDAWMDEGINTYATVRAMLAGRTRRATTSAASSAASCRGCFAISECSRETVWNRLPGYRRAPKSDLPSMPVVSLQRRERPADHLQQDRALAEHAGAIGSAGRTCSARSPRSSSGGSSSTRSRPTSSM